MQAPGAPEIPAEIPQGRVDVTSSAGLNSTVLVNSPHTTIGITDPAELARALVALLPNCGSVWQVALEASGGVPKPGSKIDAEVEVFRNLLDDGFPSKALEGFNRILDGLPAAAEPEVVFKLKANIGICHLRLGDVDAAVRWIEDGCSATPEAPKAVAHQALALILKGRQREAFEIAKRGLEKDPRNEWLAVRLFHAALNLPDVDPESLVPKAVENHENVVLWRALYLRNKERRPEWWNHSEDGSRRYPNNRTLAQFAAEAAIDRIAIAQYSSGKKVAQGAENAKLTGAIKVLETQIANLRRSEQGNRDDISSTLNSIMVAYRFLGNRDESLKIARELVEGSDFDQILFNAVQVALAFEDNDLAKAGLAKVPDVGRSAYLRGMFAFNGGKWDQAVEHFCRADVPEEERKVVEAIRLLAPFADSSRTVSKEELEAVYSSVRGDVRASIVLARMAGSHGLMALAEEVFREALSRIGSGSPEPDRLMAAAYANDRGDATSVIQVLDGYVDRNVLSAELQWLADAHASESPRRERNLAFFTELPREIRQAPAIMRAHASRLLDAGDAKAAERLLRQVAAQMPADVFCHMRLLQALRSLKRDADATSLVRTADEKLFVDRFHLCCGWACELRDAGENLRALAMGYELVRRHPNNPAVAQGYLGLVFGRMDEDFMPSVSTCETGCFVELTGPDGEKDAFIVDDGAQMPGIEVVAPSSDRAIRVMGKTLGDEIVSHGPLGQSRTWKVTSLKSKFLHLLHVILEQFEKRFPGTDGFWRMSISEGNVQPVLDMIREKADAVRQTIVEHYVEKHLPLAFLAPAIGGEEIGLGQYLRFNGIDLAVCESNHPEREAAIAECRRMRGKGAVLDTFTAWTCAELGLLDVLKRWFGTLSLSQYTIDRIDRLVDKEEAGLGQRGMSIGWHDGQFLRQDIDDEHIRTQVKALNAVKGALLLNCEVTSVDLPNDIEGDVASIVRMGGPGCVDPVYLAAERGALLLCEDLNFRRFAMACRPVAGAWLQAALAAALEDGELGLDCYANSTARLADRRHRPVAVSPDVLAELFHSSDLKAFGAVCECLGGSSADMWSHVSVAFTFLSGQWSSFPLPARIEEATSKVLSCLIAGRKDWAVWMALLWHQAQTCPGLIEYLAGWTVGHFLPVGEIDKSYRTWSQFFASRSQPRIYPFSIRALLVSLNEASEPGSSFNAPVADISHNRAP